MDIPEEVVNAVNLLLRPFKTEFHGTCNVKDDTVWLPLAVAAKQAGISRWTLRRWLKKGEIRAFKSSKSKCGRILVSKQSLDEHLEKIRVVPEDALTESGEK